VKSPDLTGDGSVNFWDTFQLLPCLASATGYCCDFDCASIVNFWDTFQYLPHLTGAHTCSGVSLAGAGCTITCN
jgi:hypothetical protein